MCTQIINCLTKFYLAASHLPLLAAGRERGDREQARRRVERRGARRAWRIEVHNRDADTELRLQQRRVLKHGSVHHHRALKIVELRRWGKNERTFYCFPVDKVRNSVGL